MKNISSYSLILKFFFHVRFQLPMTSSYLNNRVHESIESIFLTQEH